MMDTEQITERQKELLVWIIEYIAENKYAPTIKEMEKAMGVRSVAPIQNLLRRLREKGYVTWIDGRARTIQVLINPLL